MDLSRIGAKFVRDVQIVTTTSQVPTFFIGPVPIYGDLALSPMAGFSDVPFRCICRELGSAISYTACVQDEAVFRGGRRTTKQVDFLPEERPVAIQMLSKDEERLVQVCLRLMALEPDLIDINLGCPSRRVAGHGRGAALLRDPSAIGHMASRLVQALPVPVTAKIRLGWDEQSKNYVEVARVLDDSGVSAIAVHGRTKVQGYRGKANWQAIGEVKDAVRVPVLANGDVRTVGDIEAIKAMTGCDGVLIGRSAIGNPWIFARRSVSEVPWEERLGVIRRHLMAMIDYYGEHVGMILFRKHVVKYTQMLAGGAALRPRLVSTETPGALLEILEGWSPGTA